MSRTSTASSSPPSSLGTRIPPTVPERPDDVRRALLALGVVPSKRWGQTFLTDPFVADAEVALLEASVGEPVLEVGGGLGILSAAILRRGLGPLTVVERDRRLAAFLRSCFGRRLRVVLGDARDIELPRATVAVGNLPYSAATPILGRLFAARLRRVVFLVQREVAERLAAAPGSKAYGRLSVWAQLYGHVELYRTVGPAAFTPRPQVESRLAVHVAREGPLPVPSVVDFERVVAVLFSERRKQLKNLLRRLPPTPEAAERAASEAGWPADWRHRRPEELAPESYFALCRALGPA